MASSEGGSSSKISDFKARLAKLHSKRNEAARLNHQEVVEEDKLKKMPKNHIKKRERLEMELHEEEEKAAAEREGKDYNRQKMLSVSAVDAERWERKKKKKNPDEGQYDRLIKGVKVDLEEYEKEKAAVGEQAFYREDNTISIGLHKDSPDAIDSMVKDLENQIIKREKYSRRRIFDDDDDINFINERNMKFNKKLERFYGQYTEEIKQNLERGTAV
ncbi:Pre-mRNA-splicing factor syf2 [Armadillidium nasatum]|uniref:Pre-mRNA-splicing factor SYF2 n=1 Tax=Armadillidium nasatum TaxID=96803 RepID=A0A5N5T5J4_9CRUS|nr:Pre-mRNA-splicing factor syf2 [Armadillidium nasatum]